MKQVLVLNSGSSSIKYQLLDMTSHAVLVSGTLEGIGEEKSKLTHKITGAQTVTTEQVVPDIAAGFDLVTSTFERNGGMPTELVAVGHRVAQGGDKFTGATLMDDDAIAEVESMASLAPLHTPSNAAGIRLARKIYPDVPQVAVFDTAFHSTMPARAYRYALPTEISERLHIRRYGFHGTSHGYVFHQAAEYLGGDPSALKMVTLHLGNGASLAAVDGGRSIDTSMGMTPLEGLVMGTRSGDLDPAVVLYLQRVGGLSVDEVDELLNRKSGLKGLTGSNDSREVCAMAEAGDQAAIDAMEIFSYRICKYVGAYAVALGRLDALVFTAGIGENSVEFRAQICAGLGIFGVKLDPERNAVRSGEVRTISAPDSAVPVIVAPTNEELEIAQQALAVATAGH